MTEPITAVLADDEPLARDAIRIRLEQEASVEIVGEAEDGAQTVDLVRRLHPDILFLDIQMPELDGFEVVEAIASEHLPVVVFVTAHDDYALRAFDVHALDYLVKPFTAERFHQTVQRATLEVAKSGDTATHQRLIDLLDQREQARRIVNPQTAANTPLLRFAVTRNGRVVLVRTDDVDWIEADGNYVQIHTQDQVHTLRMTMVELEKRLDPSRFARIHRGTIVQIDRIAEIEPAWHGDYFATLTDGTRLKVTRTYRRRIMP